MDPFSEIGGTIRGSGRTEEASGDRGEMLFLGGGNAGGMETVGLSSGREGRTR